MVTSLQNRILQVLILGMMFLLVPSLASAFFSDTETSEEQSFVGAELLFESSFDNQDLYMGPGLATEHTFILPATFSSTSVANKYDVQVTETSGNTEFCAALALETALGSEVSTGYFGDFASAPISEPGEVTVSIFYDDTKRAIPHNATCTAEVVVEAWQANMSKTTAGYRDQETFTITVTAHMVVLNEVLARPNTTDTTVPNVEFIELYNNSDFPVDVLGFNITELAGILPTNHLIANISTAPGSALVAYNGSFTTIVPAHGFLALKYRGNSNYLNDTGDTITLIGTNGIAIDAYRYTTALVGKSDARIPDGVGAWVDPVPTPNEENVAELLEELPVATTTASTTDIFTDLLVAENATSTETEIVVASSTASSSESSMEEEEETEDVPTTAEESEEEVTPIVEEVLDEVEEEAEEVPPSEPLPLSDTDDAEDALLDPEPAVKNTEEEVEVEEKVEEVPPTDI